MISFDEVCPLLSSEEIEQTVTRLADEISRDYREKNPLILGILNGSFVFMADLIRKLTFPLEIDFTRLSSYGKGTVSSGNVRMSLEPLILIEGRHVLVVDDIIDTGYSLAGFVEYTKKKQPESLKLCVLADKPSRRKVSIDIDYKGFTVPDQFLVGYGLDFDSKYRNLPEICILGKDNNDR